MNRGFGLVFVNSGCSIALWLAVVLGCAALFSPLLSRQRHREEFRVRHGWLTVLTRRYLLGWEVKPDSSTTGRLPIAFSSFLTLAFLYEAPLQHSWPLLPLTFFPTIERNKFSWSTNLARLITLLL